MRWELTEIGENPIKLVRRAIVAGVPSDVKTKYSNAGMPLDPALAEVLRKWQRKTRFQNPEDWVFASPFRAGRTPWDPWSIERRHIIPAALRCGFGRITGTVSGTRSGHSWMKPELP
jgi:hypothetical protein